MKFSHYILSVMAAVLLTACTGSNSLEPVQAEVVVEDAAAVETASSVAVPQQLTVADGVFTQAQVDGGQLVYDASCKNCHNMRFYRDILRSWNGSTVLDFWYSILGEMPADNPGSLYDSEYTEVIAYILSENGFPVGDLALDPNNGMDRIKLVSP